MYIVKCFSVSVFHNLCLSEMLDGLLSSFTSISYLINLCFISPNSVIITPALFKFQNTYD